MFRIGDFSRIAHVSTRLLRFYDEIGLLKPAHADPFTGYRSYRVAQLAQLNRITVLKDLGFSLEQIGTVLAANLGAEELRGMLLLRRNDVQRTLALEAERLRQIETRIEQIEVDGELSAEDVVIRPEPAHRVLSMRRSLSGFGAAVAAIGELQQRVRSLLKRRAAGPLIVVSHAPQFDPDALDLEFCMVVDGSGPQFVPDHSGLQLAELPAVPRMAVCVRVGPPDQTHLQSARIGAFVERSGSRFDGPSREVFRQPPDPLRLHEAVIELQFPLGDG
jgi:DNA-binding transcriptional MerR regulator